MFLSLLASLRGESIKSQIDRGVTSGTPGEFDLNFGAESLLTRINYGNTIFLFFNAFQTKSIGIDGQYDADSSNINREQGLLFYLGHNFEFKNGSRFYDCFSITIFMTTTIKSKIKPEQNKPLTITSTSLKTIAIHVSVRLHK